MVRLRKACVGASIGAGPNPVGTGETFHSIASYPLGAREIIVVHAAPPCTRRDWYGTHWVGDLQESKSRGTSAVATLPVTIVGLALVLAYQEQAPAPAQPKPQPKAKAKANTSGWAAYTSRDGDYRVEFPARPAESTRIIPSRTGNLEQKSYVVRAGGCIYLLQQTRYSRPFPVLGVADQLTQWKQGYLQGQVQLVRENDVTASDVVGQHFEYQTPSPRANGTINHVTRHFIRGSSYILLSVTTSPNQPLPRDADRFLDSFTFLTPPPGRGGAMAKGGPAGKAATAQPESPDGTPEEALRTFMVAAVAHDEEALRAITLPDPELEWLVRGEPAPEEVVARMRTLAKAMKIRRLKPGERIRGPQGKVAAVSPDDIGEDRALLLPEGAPSPVRARRVDGKWKIDARPAINQRKEAAAALQKGGRQ